MGIATYENRSTKEILKASWLNLWANKVLVILALLLIAVLWATSDASCASRAITIVAIMAILTKAESRPQPISVALMAATLSILSAIGGYYDCRPGYRTYGNI